MTNSYPSWPHSVTKLDAAERQLITAIRIFFTNGDAIAVHSLAGASAEILETLCDHNGLRPFREHAKETNSSLSNKEFWELRNKHRNFFKHANADPTTTIDFSDENNDGVLFVATHDLGLLREGQMPPESQVLNAWFCAVNLEKVIPKDEFYTSLNRIFPGINRLPRYQQKRMGFEALEWAHSEPALLGKIPWTGESKIKFK